MKKLDLDAVFLMSAVLDKTGIIFDIQDIVKSIKTDELKSIEDAQKIGKEAMLSIVAQLAGSLSKSMYKAKDEIKELIAHLADMDIDEVGKMTFKEIKEFFIDLVKAEGFSDFFKEAAELSD